MSFKRIFLLTLVAAALTSATALWADPPSVAGRINLIDGEVSFRPGSLDEWVPATLNYPLTSGDELWTDSTSQAEIHIGAAAIRLAPGTDLSILLLDDQSVQLQLNDGTLNVRLRRMDAGESFEVGTPAASVTLLEPGSYRINVADDGSSDYIVRSGKANVESDASSVPVFPGQQVTAFTAEDYLEVAAAPAPDEWDRWCAVRDAREDRLASSPYVSQFMVGYEDLEAYGSWEPVAGYGVGWVPRHLPGGWAPYRFGHWAWVDPWGWTWIDEEPWGFAPFHYGRWAFVAGTWVWLPGPRVARPCYAPALVVFVGGGDRGPIIRGSEGIGWFPLGPHEVYVPPYRASVAYVQRINIDIGPNIRIDIDVTRLHYVNRTVAGALTFVPRRDFVRAEPVRRVALPPQPDLIQAPVTGMGPRLIPDRESVLGRPQAPAGRVPRPPVEIRNRPAVIRRAPPAAPMPFEERRRQLQTRPDQPFDLIPAPEQQQREGPAVRPGFRVLPGPRADRPEGRAPEPQQRLRPPQQQDQRQDLIRPPDNGPGVRAPQRGPDQGTGRGQIDAPQRPQAGGPTVDRAQRDERPTANNAPTTEKRKVRVFVNGHWVETEQDVPANGRNRN